MFILLHVRLLRALIKMNHQSINLCSAVYLLLFSACLVITMLFVIYRIVVFTFGICCLQLVLMLFLLQLFECDPESVWQN